MAGRRPAFPSRPTDFTSNPDKPSSRWSMRSAAAVTCCSAATTPRRALSRPWRRRRVGGHGDSCARQARARSPSMSCSYCTGSSPSGTTGVVGRPDERDHRHPLCPPSPARVVRPHPRAALRAGPALRPSGSGCMIDAWLCRGNVNKNIARVRRAFKWGVAEGAGAVARAARPPIGCRVAARAVGGPRWSRSSPCPTPSSTQCCPSVSRPVKAMIELQRLTGMRPGEVGTMRACDIDTTGKVWLYRPATHKSMHRGKGRTVPLVSEGGGGCEGVPDASSSMPSCSRRSWAGRAICGMVRGPQVARPAESARSSESSPSPAHRVTTTAPRAIAARSCTAACGPARRRGTRTSCGTRSRPRSGR